VSFVLFVDNRRFGVEESVIEGGNEMKKEASNAGFSLPELLITITIIGIIAAMAIPAMSSYYGESCIKAVISEIAGMMKEAKQLALTQDRYYAISFNTASGRISLLSGRGPDGAWNTADDEVVRSFRLADKGGGLNFGYGSCGPLPNLAATADGVTFQSNNTAVCNPDLTGNAGTVYIRAACGAAMALTLNSRDFSYSMWKWSGKKWVKM
jgi:prepilin-type N-terminal cleavage/methylation domain-containing protein